MRDEGLGSGLAWVVHMYLWLHLILFSTGRCVWLYDLLGPSDRMGRPRRLESVQ